MKQKKSFRLLCIALLFVLVFSLLSACASSGGYGDGAAARSYETASSTGYGYEAPQAAAMDSGYNDAYDYDVAVEEAAVDGEMMNVVTGGGDSGVQLDRTAATDRKIITTVDLRMESTDYDVCVNDVYQAIQEAGGYVEYSDITGGIDPGAGASGVSSSWNGAVTLLGADYEYYRSGERSLYLRIRVPEANLPGFLSRLEGLGNVLSKQESAEDVTLQYVDMQSRLNALQAEQEQLLSLLEQCDSIEEMILLQDRLSYVRYQIESYESQLRVMQNQVSYSTVNLRINEVVVYTEKDEFNPTVSQRISTGFSRTLANIKAFWVNQFVWLAVNSIYIVVLVVAVVVVVVLLRRRLRRRAKPGPRNGESKAAPTKGGDDSGQEQDTQND